MITAEQWMRLNDIIKDIYSFELAQIPRALFPSIKREVSFSHSMFHFSRMVDGTLAVFNYASVDLPQSHLDLYRDKYESIDYINWFADEVTPRVFRDTDVVPASIREQSAFMREWLEPFGMFYSAGITIAHDDCPYGNIYLFRSREEGDFSEAELEVLSILNEHLCIRYERELPGGMRERSRCSSKCSELIAHAGLTEREAEIVTLIESGVLRRDLPVRLCISENTLKKHLANIFRKLGIRHYEELLQSLGAKWSC